jgi:signal peptidase I
MASDTTSGAAPIPWWQLVTVGSNPRVTLIRAVTLVILCVITFSYILIPMRVTGVSMEPTYQDGSVNFINRFAFLLNEPARGEVVAIRTTGLRVLFLKRVIAMPGESFRIQRGIVYINDTPLDEPYSAERARWNHPETLLDSNEYLVIGDNRTMEKGQHVFRVVPRERIVGRILW